MKICIEKCIIMQNIFCIYIEYMHDFLKNTKIKKFKSFENFKRYVRICAFCTKKPRGFSDMNNNSPKMNFFAKNA